jgi:chromosomal replication initiation ATPase DnaA
MVSVSPTSAELAEVQAVVHALGARGLLELLDDICRGRGVVREELCGRRRSRSVARARQELWWQIKNLPDRNYSYCEIARMFGRDHTTVVHGVLAYRRRVRPADRT